MLGKLARFAQAYHELYGRWPSRIEVTPNMLRECGYRTHFEMNMPIPNNNIFNYVEEGTAPSYIKDFERISVEIVVKELGAS